MYRSFVLIIVSFKKKQTTIKEKAGKNATSKQQGY